jgi:UDP-glucose 4-epimerase
VDGTRKVTDYSKRNGCKLIYAGSSSKHHNPELSPYAMSKHMGEEWIKMEKNIFGIDAEIVRFYNVYGPGELVDSHMAAVIGLWRHAISKGEPIIIHGDGEQRRDFTHVSDVVNANMLAATTNLSIEDFGQLYNVGYGKNYSINEIAKIISNKIVNIPARLGESRETLSDNSKIRKKLGWKPTISLTDWIKSSV